jgi:hydrogenase maturation factor
MRPGKVAENVLKRSILKFVKNRREEVVIGAGIGNDSAVLRLDSESVVLTTTSVFEESPDSVFLGIQKTVNNLASSGGEAVGILVNLLLQEFCEEEEIKNLMKRLEEEAAKENLQIIGGDTRLLSEVNRPVISITGVGKAENASDFGIKKVRPGQDILIAGYIGLGGTYKALASHEKELRNRFPSSFLRNIQEIKGTLSVKRAALLAVKEGCTAMHDASEGGIFKALWEIGSGSGLGLEAELKKIPVRQETIEVTELLEKNPYTIDSTGALIIITDNGKAMVRKFEKENIPIIHVGRMTEKKARILLTGEGKRYLESK